MSHVKIKNHGIKLTDKERQIFDLLLETNKKFDLGLNIYVVGGWTRDKLLGRDSDDIDIAIEGMTGAAFCNDHLSRVIGKRAAVIEARPDQSKHLETATMHVLDQKVEFANLRSEEYADSRIPTIKMGTLIEDATRRDLTIGAMYYNLHDGCVEDLVGGLDDLLGEQIVLRAPCNPLIMLQDDPLRVFRAARFFAKWWNSYLDPALEAAMKDERVHVALMEKVSMERVAVELKKLMLGEKPAQACKLLYDCGLLQLLLDVPSMANCMPFTMDQMTHWHKFNVLEHTLEVMKWAKIICDQHNIYGDKRALFLLAVLFHDLGKLDPRCWGYKYKDSNAIVAGFLVNSAIDEGLVRRTYHEHEVYSAEHAEAIMNNLKMGADEIAFVKKLVIEHMGPHGGKWTDKAIRKCINRWGDDWPILWYHAIADTMGSGRADDAKEDCDLKFATIERGKVLEQTDPNPPQNNKPVLSGLIIMKMIPELPAKTGFIRKVQDYLMEMRFEDPALTEEASVAIVEQMKPQLLKEFMVNSR